jgi:hypothetical protein
MILYHSLKKSNMKLYALAFITCLITNAQPIIRTTIQPPNPDTTYWNNENKVGLDFTQIAFSNWNAGGNSSVSGLLRGTFGRKYIKENILWNNELLIRYGINKQEDRELRKTDDQFLVNSNFGYKKSPNSKWFYSGRFNFTSQFVEGYAYPNKEIAISSPFAPAYLFLGVGSEYNDKAKKFNVYMSPLTAKGTLVWNQRLADQGAFGVDKAVFDEQGNILQRGKRHRTEMGILINNYWKKEVYKNIVFENRVTVFADYLGYFGNIDIDWQMQLDMTINEYVRANVGIHMIYDDDIKAKKEIDGQQVTVGPRLQLKQMLGVGMVYQF